MQPNELLECDFVGTGAHFVNVSALWAMCAFYPERAFVYEDENDGNKQKKMTELYPIGLVGPNTPEGRLRRIEEILDAEPEDLGEDELCDDPSRSARRIEMIHKILSVIDPGESRLLGEDYHWSFLARKAGIRLWCDMKNVIGHVGDAVYPISTDAISQAAPIPTHTLNLDKY